MSPHQTSARTAIAVLAGLTVLTAAGCGSGFDSSAEQQDGGKQKLTMLIASAGISETNAVKQVVADWGEKTGNTVKVEVAKDINQQLGQGFAGGEPQDIFYVNPDQFANYASGGSLYPYGDQIENLDDFPASLKQTFTYRGKLMCAPKDGGTLGLEINTGLWKKAGLTAADYPKTWDDLTRVAKKLTKGDVTGMVTADDYQSTGPYLLQGGGWFTNDEQTKMTALAPGNVTGLDFVKARLQDGSFKYAKQLDATWPGEAFGKQRAAMTVQGGWIVGAMKADYPDVGYKVLPLPAGPAGKGNLSFTNCWGIAQQSKHHKAAVDLAKYLSDTQRELKLAELNFSNPARVSASKQFAAKHPEVAPFSNFDGAHSIVTAKGMDRVMNQFNAELLNLKTADPKKILGNLQRNGTPVLEKSAK